MGRSSRSRSRESHRKRPRDRDRESRDRRESRDPRDRDRHRDGDRGRDRNRSGSRERKKKRRAGSLDSDKEDVRPQKASQKMVDDLEDKIDKVENAFDLCQVLAMLQTACITDNKFTQGHKASFFMSFMRKATTYYVPQLCEPMLKFIDKYLTAQNIRQIDFVLTKYLDQVQSHPQSDKQKAWFRRVTDGRRKDHLRPSTAKVCPSCGLDPNAVGTASANAPAATTVVDDGAISVDTPAAAPKEKQKSEQALLQEEMKVMMQQVDTRPGPTLSEEKRRVQSLFSGGSRRGRRDEDDEEIEAVGLQVSLQCPLSFMRIMTPVKGYDCKHIQCFDLESFLLTNLGKKGKKKRKDDRDRRGDEWLCPVCNHEIRKQDVYVDKYFLDMLNKVSVLVIPPTQMFVALSLSTCCVVLWCGVVCCVVFCGAQMASFRPLGGRSQSESRWQLIGVYHPGS